MMIVKFIADLPNGESVEQVFEADSVRAIRRTGGGMVLFHRPPHHKYLEETHLVHGQPNEYHTAFVMNESGATVAKYQACADPSAARAA